MLKLTARRKSQALFTHLVASSLACVTIDFDSLSEPIEERPPSILLDATFVH